MSRTVSRRAFLPLSLALPAALPLAACAQSVPAPHGPAVALPGPAVPPLPESPAVTAVTPVHREPPVLSAASVFVWDLNSENVLLEHASDQPRPGASTAKIMTALVVLERVPEDQLDVPFRVGVMRPRPGETLMGLRTGQEVTVRQLLYGTLLPSGNDAADALAVRVAGSERRFVDLMNRRAAELGLEGTRYVNPSGLDGQGGQTTARDLARLAAHAMQHPTFAHIAGQRTYVLPPTEGAPEDEAERTLVNNSLPIHFYPGVTGVKPGWTPRAGTCQVISAALEGRSVIAVVLNTDPATRDVVQILDWVFGTTTELAPPDHDRTTVRGIGPDGQPWAFFAATHQRVAGAFLRAFDRFGGLDQLGPPAGAPTTEGGRLVQRFERGRMEHNPRAASAAGEVTVFLQPASV